MEQDKSPSANVTITTRKRGAPKGNQNACRHGYYSKVSDAERRAALVRLPPLAQIDAQIEWFTAKARAVRQRDPLNTRVLHVAAARIARLQRSRTWLERLNRDAAFRRKVSDAFLDDGVVLNLPYLTGETTSQAETGEDGEIAKRTKNNSDLGADRPPARCGQAGGG